MPDTKNALIRYRIINRCLIDYDYCTLEQLKEACERALDISPLGDRTIAQDISDMRYDERLGYSAPIKFSKHYGGYYYEDPDYSIDNLSLNNEEIDALNFASTLLGQMKDTGVFNKFSGAVQKIVDAVQIQKALFTGPEFDFIDFERVPFVKGSEFLEDLIGYIHGKKPVELLYQSFVDPEPVLHILHPYLLKEYRNRWYLIGHDENHDDIRTFGLDRIESVDPATVKFIEKEFDAEEYFRNTVGVFSPSGDPPLIRIAFKKPMAYYLLTQPWHSSQVQVAESAGEITFEFKVHPTYEFKSLILGYGRSARVLDPSGLREEILAELQDAMGQY
jgi:predicted DNA-binding transcriptional regulator YafY